MVSPGLALQAPGGVDRHREADAVKEVEILGMVAIGKGTGKVQVMGAGQIQEQAQFILPPGMEAGDLPGKKAAVPGYLRGNEPIPRPIPP